MILPTVNQWYRNQILIAKILVGASTILCILFLTIDIFVNRGLWEFCLVFFPLTIYGTWFLLFSLDKYGRKIIIGNCKLQLMNWKSTILRNTPYSEITSVCVVSGYITGIKGFPKKELFLCLCLNNALLPNDFEYRNIYNNDNFYILMYDERLEKTISEKIKTSIGI